MSGKWHKVSFFNIKTIVTFSLTLGMHIINPNLNRYI